MKGFRPWVIVDLDGTLVDSSHREHLLPKEETEVDGSAWQDWEHLWYNDQPYEHIHELLRHLKDVGIAIVTSRHERTRELTMEWLMLWKIDFDEMHMCREDGLASVIHKRRVIEKKFIEEGREILLAMEDHDAVVELYRELGIPTLHIKH